jgi:hypothetical protein
MPILNLSNDPIISRRRSQRVIMSIPVTVKWKGPDGLEREEATTSLVLNVQGLLLSLAAALKAGQTLLLVNRTTNQEQACRVAHFGPAAEGRVQLGLEFLEPSPEFWNIRFPPENWSSMDSSPRSTSAS